VLDGTCVLYREHPGVSIRGIPVASRDLMYPVSRLPSPCAFPSATFTFFITPPLHRLTLAPRGPCASCFPSSFPHGLFLPLSPFFHIRTPPFPRVPRGHVPNSRPLMITQQACFLLPMLPPLPSTCQPPFYLLGPPFPFLGPRLASCFLGGAPVLPDSRRFPGLPLILSAFVARHPTSLLLQSASLFLFQF